MTYDSTFAGRFVTGWDAISSVNGEPIQLHDYLRVKSPWAHSEFGSGVLHICCGDQTHELYFNQ